MFFVAFFLSGVFPEKDIMMSIRKESSVGCNRETKNKEGTDGKEEKTYQQCRRSGARQPKRHDR